MRKEQAARDRFPGLADWDPIGCGRIHLKSDKVTSIAAKPTLHLLDAVASFGMVQNQAELY